MDDNNHKSDKARSYDIIGLGSSWKLSGFPNSTGTLLKTRTTVRATQNTDIFCTKRELIDRYTQKAVTRKNKECLFDAQ